MAKKENSPKAEGKCETSAGGVGEYRVDRDVLYAIFVPHHSSGGQPPHFIELPGGMTLEMVKMRYWRLKKPLELKFRMRT